MSEICLIFQDFGLRLCWFLTWFVRVWPFRVGIDRKWWCRGQSCLGSHSDANLDDLGKDATKEDDRAVLLEAGLTRSASAKLHASSIKLNLIKSRFLIMDGSFLLENPMMLRAIATITIFSSFSTFY